MIELGYAGIETRQGPGPYHTLWYKVVPMATKSGTLHVGRKAAQNALHAVRFVAETGRPMNTHVTVSFTALRIEDEEAGPLFRHLQGLVGRWWRDQRTRKGRNIGPLQGFHCHSNPAGSRHVHWCLRVPPEIEAGFRATVTDRLQKLTSRIELGDGLHFGAVTTPGTLAKYILRGIEPEYAAHYMIEPANEGLVRGCRRSGVSRAASKAARQAAGWVRKRRLRA